MKFVLENGRTLFPQTFCMKVLPQYPGQSRHPAPRPRLPFLTQTA